MTYTLDVELFISEVKKYPEIWDVKCESYKFKNRKQSAWAEIARVLIQDFDELPTREKDDVYKKLNNKWRNIRDSFVRNNKKKDGKRDYMYAKQLSFLYNVYTKTGSDEEWSDSEDSNTFKKLTFKTKREVVNDTWQSDDEPIESVKRKRARHENDAIEYVDSIIPDATCSYANEDEDKSFFDSLLPAVRKFDLDQKLEFRSEVIRLIKNIRSGRKFKLDPTSGEFN